MQRRRNREEGGRKKEGEVFNAEDAEARGTDDRISE
jgi:hypothetical protein